MDWAPYGVRPTGDRKSRRFTVTDPEGFSEGGKRYRHGDVISQRQALNRKYRMDAGWESRSEYEREARTRDFRNWTTQVGHAKGRDVRSTRAAGSDFSRAWVQWKRAGFASKGRARKPGGAFARFLEGIGYRDEGAGYAVGDTPTAGGKH